MNRPWKLILLLVGIFVAGVATGACIDWRRLFDQGTTKTPRSTVAVELWAPKQLTRLTDNLDLTAAQLDQIRPIIRRYMEELDRLRTYSRNETGVIFERMEREIGEKLSAEQRVKFDQITKERRERVNNDGRPDDRRRGERPPLPPGSEPAPEK